MTQDPSQRPQTRRSVALLLMVGALAATFFLLRGLRDRPAPIETAAPLGPAEMIERLGGKVERSGSEALAVTMRVATDRNLQLVARLENVVSLDLSGSAVTDQGLQRLRDMTSLEILTLENTHISDDGLKPLRSLSELRRLSLAGTPIRGPGLVSLQDLPNLKVLFLGRTQIEDDALLQLSAMPQLELLFLNGTPLDEKTPGDGERRDGQITDVGLMRLRNLTRLKIVDVRHTNVTEAGVTAFRAELPTCHVQR